MSTSESSEHNSRRIRFPRDRSLGQLFAYHGSATEEAKWIFRGNARGDVSVPRDDRIVLDVDPSALGDLSPLLKLGHSDLYGVVMPPQDQVADVHLAALAALTGLEVLDLRFCKVTDAGLSVLRSFHSLQRLVVISANVTDAGMVHLEKLSGLRSLNLNGTKITDAGLERLRGLTALEELFLGGTQISDAGLANLTGLRSLRKLVLATTRSMTDVALDHISRIASLQELDVTYTSIGVTGRGLGLLKALQNLNLTGTPATDECLAQLAGAHALRTLNLMRTAITNRGLSELSGLRRLSDLNLSETRIGDAGLLYIGRITSLKRLILKGTDVTDAGLFHLANLVRLTELWLPDTVEGAGLGQLHGLRKLKYLRVSRKIGAGPLAEIRRQLPSCTIAN